MRSLKVLFILLLAAVPVAARGETGHVEVRAWGSFLHTSGTTTTDERFGVDINFEDGGGGGLTVDVSACPWFSVEAGGFLYRPTGAIRVGGQPVFGLGHFDVAPLFALVEAHPAGRGDVDPYVGVGATYVIFGNLHSGDLDAAGIGVVEVKNKFAFAASAGLRLALTKHFGLLLDGKYLVLKPESRGAAGAPVDLKLYPFLISVGGGWRF